MMLKSLGIVVSYCLLIVHSHFLLSADNSRVVESQTTEEALLLELEDLIEKDPVATQNQLEKLRSETSKAIDRRTLRIDTLICEAMLSQGFYVSAYEESSILIKKYTSFDKQARYGYLLLCHALASEHTGRYKDSTDLYNKAVQLAIMKGDLILHSKALRLRGDFYAFHGTVEDALLDLQESYRLSERIKDTKGVFRTKNSLAILYSYINDDQKAMEYYEEVYLYAKDEGLLRPMSILTFNLGKAHHRLNNLVDAARYFIESENLSRSLNDSAGIAYALRGQALISLERNDYESAKPKLEEVVSLFNNLGSEMQVAQTTMRLAEVYLKTNQFQLSIKLHLNAINVFEEKNSIYSLSQAYKQLSSVYATVEDFEKAYLAHEKYVDLYNDYRKQDHAKRLEELRVVFDTERAEVANKLLSKQNRLTSAELEQQIQFSKFQTWIIGLGFLFVISLAFQVRRNIQNKKQLELLVRTDELTQLANRRYIMELIEREFKLALRGNATPSLIMFDIDHFKNFNDEFGHRVGDEVLQAVSNCCQIEVRSTDVLGRIGGEEFLILLPQTHQTDAMEVAERCRVAVEKLELDMIDENVSITISLGSTLR